MRQFLLFLPFVFGGVCGQLFSVEPRAEYVVKQTDNVTIECVLASGGVCAWKLVGTSLTAEAFLLSQIPSNLGISARDLSTPTDCSIVIESIDARYDGDYICSPYLATGGQENSRVARVITAHKPMKLEFVDQYEYNRLAVVADEPTTVACQAVQSMPAAQLAWYLDNTQLYDGVQMRQLNLTNSSHLVTTRSTLTRTFGRQASGARLRCVAAHVAYDPADQRELELLVDVTYAPYRVNGNNIGTLYGYTDGQKARITVNFTANPPPAAISWLVGEEQVPAGGQLEEGRFRALDMETLDAASGLYSLSLEINPVRLEDQRTAFLLHLENSVGTAEMNFNLSTDPVPHVEALSSGAMGGIIIIVLLLILIVALVAYARSQGKWCFTAAKSTEETTEADTPTATATATATAADNAKPKCDKRSFNLSAFCSSLMSKKPKEVDVELGEKKEEVKETLQPQQVEAGGDAGDGKKSGEVVYAELMLAQDGQKAPAKEVHAAGDNKTEYAVIVGNQKEAEDNGAK